MSRRVLTSFCGTPKFITKSSLHLKLDRRVELISVELTDLSLITGCPVVRLSDFVFLNINNNMIVVLTAHFRKYNQSENKFNVQILVFSYCYLHTMLSGCSIVVVAFVFAFFIYINS
jgi:hypothetical protein